jgi:glutamate carboxypeptidase
MEAERGPVHADLISSLRDRLDDMTADLAELVGHESPSADLDLLAGCADALCAMASRLLGADPERVEVEKRTHLVWRFGPRPRVLLIGHYDTVWPAGTLARWPFRVEGGRATGPGVFDMKAGIVQMFHALSTLPEADLNRDGVSIVLTADEELGSQTSRELVEATASGTRATLVLEPSQNGALKIARKGSSMYEVHVIGRSAHAGLEPEKGINATVELAHQVLAVDHLGRPEVGTTVTPTVVSGGTTTNTVPAAAVLHVDARAEDPAELKRVDGGIRALRAVLPGTELRIEGGISRPPMPTSSSAALFDLASSVGRKLGLEPVRGVAVGGASDGNFTAGMGVATLDGMGAVGDRAHAEEEYTLLSAMPERAALLAGVISELLDGT